MKHILTIIFALGCVALGIALFLTKSNDSAQFAKDADAFTECSNTMVAVQGQVTICNVTISTLSNSLDACQSAVLTSSNDLVAAQSVIAVSSDRVNKLTSQVAQMGADNESLVRRFMDVTNQMNSQIDALNAKVALTETNLAEVQHDHVLLEERLRRDVAERLVIERKFYNFDALQAQMDKLKAYPGLDVTADKIYAGLDVEVRSNGTIHVLSPE